MSGMDKFWIYGSLCAACFFAGIYVTTQHYKEVIADTEARQAKAWAEAVVKAEKEKKENEEKILVALNERDALLDKLNERDADLFRLTERLRQSARNSGKPVPRTNSYTCEAERKAVARCRDLLSEGAELLSEGARRIQRNAADHDALGEYLP